MSRHTCTATVRKRDTSTFIETNACFIWLSVTTLRRIDWPITHGKKTMKNTRPFFLGRFTIARGNVVKNRTMSHERLESDVEPRAVRSSTFEKRLKISGNVNEVILGKTRRPDLRKVGIYINEIERTDWLGVRNLVKEDVDTYYIYIYNPTHFDTLHSIYNK